MNTTVTDCGLHEPFLESLAGSEEESRRVAAQAGLLVLRIVDRFANRDFQTEAESIQYQIAAARKFVAGEVLEPEVRDLLDETLAAAARVLTTGSTEVIFAPLIDYGRWLEGNLQLDAAIDVYDTLLAVGGTPDNHALVLCWRGRALRIAGRIDDSIAEYAKARETAESTGNRQLQLRGRVGVAMGHKRSGDLSRADSHAREALRHAREWGETHMEAVALHVIADGLSLMGRDHEAIPLLFDAYQLNQNEWDRPRVMSDIGLAFKNLGKYESARHAFSIALPGLTSAETRMNAINELLEIESARGDREGFDRWREELERSVAIMPPEIKIDFYMKLGHGLFLFGETDEGALFLKNAMLLAEFPGLNAKYFAAESKLAELERESMSVRSGAASESAEDAHPELNRVAEQLEALDLETA